MTLTLILMRHAKSDWGIPGLSDHDRPLNGRGSRVAPVMGQWLRKQGHLPDQVLCSTAMRTRQTLEGLGINAPTMFLAALYHADPATMQDALQQAQGHKVLMIGHNPGIATFADHLLQHAPEHPRFFDYPTCATLVAEFDLEKWADLGPAMGRALDFVIPADLA